MRSIAVAVAVMVALSAQACELPGGGKSVENSLYTLVYRSQPERIKVGEHFALDLAVCPKGAKAPPGTVGVDARMPEHRHGMNYKAAVRSLGAGRFRAEGLMFHMPGRWELVFVVGGERLADSIRME